MRKIISTLFLAILLFIPVIQVDAAKQFRDVNTYKDEINYLADLSIINGYEDGTFRPNTNVTNTHMAVMLARTLKLNLNNPADPGFKDVPKTHHAYKAIAASVERGLFPKSDYFYPSKASTRQAMARAIVVGLKLEGDGTKTFPDVYSSNKNKTYISILAENNITTGYLDGTFRPDAALSRAHFSAFLARALSEEFKPSPNLSTVEIANMHDKRIVTIYTNSGQGSGILVGNGLVLTNEHVIDHMRSGHVQFDDGEKVTILGVVKKDAKKDLALIKLAENKQIEKVVLRPFDKLAKGEKVVAIGSPLGFANTVSEGIVSALHISEGVKIIQMTAAIDSGSSGGGLFDQQGRLVGVTTSGIKESNANINFAVSVSELTPWQSIISSPYNSIQVLPIEQLQTDVFRNLALGMTKAQVKSIEKAQLVHETDTELLYSGATYKGFEIDAYYGFEDGKLEGLYFEFLGVDHLDVEHLEMLFFGILGELEGEFGRADHVDNDWNDDEEGHMLAAYWLNNLKAFWNVNMDDEVTASILIMRD